MKIDLVLHITIIRVGTHDCHCGGRSKRTASATIFDALTLRFLSLGVTPERGARTPAIIFLKKAIVFYNAFRGLSLDMPQSVNVLILLCYLDQTLDFCLILHYKAYHTESRICPAGKAGPPHGGGGLAGSCPLGCSKPPYGGRDYVSSLRDAISRDLPAPAIPHSVNDHACDRAIARTRYR